MLQRETEFRAELRKARGLKSPTSAAFSLSDWQRAFEKCGTTEDKELFETAVWISSQSTSLQAHYGRTGIEGLGREFGTILAVATLNRQFHAVTNRLDRNSKEEAHREGRIVFDHVVAKPLSSASPDPATNADGYSETLIDAVESWLWDAARAEPRGSMDVDGERESHRAIQKYMLQRRFHDLWGQTLWEFWGISGDGDSLSFRPVDFGLAKLFDAWVTRQQMQAMSGVWPEMSDWPHLSIELMREKQLSQTVISVDQKPGKRREFRVARPRCSATQIPRYLIHKATLDGSYLSLFLAEPFPRDAQLSCELLVRAWGVLTDLAEALSEKLNRPSFSRWSNVRDWSLVCKRIEIESLLSKTLGVGMHLSERIVQFFSWAPNSYRGMWAAPIIPVPGSDFVCLARPVLNIGSTHRAVEAFLVKGGLDDSLLEGARGQPFEEGYRSAVADALTKNKVVQNTAIASRGVDPTKDFEEQIDLLFRFGNILVVGEIKCLLAPSEPLERDRYLRKLTAAADQANRKARAIKARPDVSARALSLAEEEVKNLRVIPLVVVNQTFGSGLQIDDCMIVDEQFLLIYLADGKFSNQAAINPRGGTAFSSSSLYKSEGEAQSRFERNMKMSPLMQMYLDRLAWVEAALPTASGTPLKIACTILGGLRPIEKDRADLLESLVKKN